MRRFVTELHRKYEEMTSGEKECFVVRGGEVKCLHLLEKMKESPKVPCKKGKVFGICT